MAKRKSYGKTKWSVEEFTSATMQARWAKRKANVIRLLLSVENPTNKAIAREMGMPPAAVGRILAMPEIKEALRERVSGWFDQYAMQALGVVGEAMDPKMPIAIRLNAAKWALERRDHIHEQRLKQEPPRLAIEDSIEEQLKAVVQERLDRINAKAIEAQVIEKGSQCQTSPGNSTSAQPPISSEANGSQQTPDTGSTSSPKTSWDSASTSPLSHSPN